MRDRTTSGIPSRVSFFPRRHFTSVTRPPSARCFCPPDCITEPRSLPRIDSLPYTRTKWKYVPCAGFDAPFPSFPMRFTCTHCHHFNSETFVASFVELILIFIFCTTMCHDKFSLKKKKMYCLIKKKLFVYLILYKYILLIKTAILFIIRVVSLRSTHFVLNYLKKKTSCFIFFGLFTWISIFLIYIFFNKKSFLYSNRVVSSVSINR